MSEALPARPSLEWLRKSAKSQSKSIHVRDPKAKLASAQLAVARRYGFASWRKLKEHIDSVRVDERAPALFDAIRDNDATAVAQLLDANPKLVAARTDAGETPLHVAAENADAALVELLLKRGADRDLKYGESAHNAMSWAVTVGNFDAAEAIVRAGAKPDLFCAAGIGKLELVQAFFDRDGHVRPGASQTGGSRFAPGGSRLPRPPSEPRDIVSDALYIAARNGRADVVRFLLGRGADVAFHAYMGATPLHWAYFSASRDVIDVLLAAGSDPDALDDTYRCTPRAFGICVASSWGFTHLVKRQLDVDRSLVSIQCGRGSPLHEAARAGHVPIVIMLLLAGADPHARDPGGKTPAQVARAAKHPAVVKLLTPGAIGRRQSWKPLMDASLAGDDARVRKLLDAGADPNALSTTGHRYRPLHRAIEHKKTMPKHAGHECVVKLLLERGADPHLPATYSNVDALLLATGGETRFVPLLIERFRPLDIFHACACLDLRRVRELLKADATLARATDPTGRTPLHNLAGSAMFRIDEQRSREQLAIARLLLDYGADPSASYPFDDKWPLSVLYFASGLHDNGQLTELLMDAGADPCDGESVYHASDEIHRTCLALFEQRVPRKKLARECTWCLSTQLHWGRTRGMKWLLAHGADPNVPDKTHGDTALHAAIKSRRSEAVIRMLLEHGADPKVKSRDGKTAMQLARTLPSTRLVRVLEGKETQAR